jgi:hypothetical protein
VFFEDFSFFGDKKRRISHGCRAIGRVEPEHICLEYTWVVKAHKESKKEQDEPRSHNHLIVVQSNPTPFRTHFFASKNPTRLWT